MKVKSALFEAVKQSENLTTTENGLPANKTTLSCCVDLFSQGATLRKNPSQIRAKVREAYHEDKELCTRIVFYLRDIRGNSGQGERAIFREAIKELIELDANSIKKILNFIPIYGRWDDLICLYGQSPITDKEISKIIINQFNLDLVFYEKQAFNKISLLSKWLPSINTSSPKTVALAKVIQRDVFKVSEKVYRKSLSLFRQVLNLVETSISKKEYNFDYSKIPGKAMMQYRKAFLRNDEQRYKRYLEALSNAVITGDKSVKVNASTLYPYELFEKCYNGYGPSSDTNTLSLCDSMWRSLPNYFGDDKSNWLAVADVSASMTGRPMAVSVSLATYIAERNSGIFKNKYISFSNDPMLIEIDPSWPLHKKIEYVMKKDIGYGTNLIKIFDVVLNAARTNNLTEAEMPKVIVIISDMQFNAQMSDCDDRSIDIINKRYEQYGYKMPKIVYWNVADEDKKNTPVTIKDSNTILVNGCKPGMFEMIIQGSNPLDFLLKVMNSERYSQIKL